MAYLGQVLRKGTLNQNIKKKRKRGACYDTLLSIIVFYHPGKWADNTAFILQGEIMETLDSKGDRRKISQLVLYPA